MTERDKEGVSALLDDEAAATELGRLVDGLKGDGELRRMAARYGLITASLRGEDRVLLPGDFVDRVSQRLAGEPVVLAPPRPRDGRGWGRAAAGAALAASVALVAIGLLPSGELADPTDAGPGVAATSDGAEVAPFRVAASRDAASPGERGTAAVEASTASRLSRYLAEHNEFASRGGANGFMSYATFVTYDGR
jgi:hypothetical protein